MSAVSEFQTAGAEQRKARSAKLVLLITKPPGFCPSISPSSAFYFLLEQTKMIVLISALLSSARSIRHVSDNWPSCRSTWSSVPQKSSFWDNWNSSL